ncbi:hypothetical protein [uncultured Draconibacterium sp.]|uniref:hypothetical protein n=1 Tax=uncultured Draconibacterium sp. TaxID=1573823 RepID=UPI003260A754
MKTKLINALKTTYILVLFSVFTVQAQQEFHVSPTASKNGKGTLSSPFNSIQTAQKAVAKVNGNMNENIIVYLHGGTYPLTTPLVFKEKDSGTNGYSITYKAYKEETPLLSGGEKVTNWEKVKGNIYKTQLNRDSKLRTLFVNGKRKQIAVTNDPVAAQGNWGEFKIQGNEPWALGAGKAIDGIKFLSDEVGSYNNPEDIELVQFNIWTEKILCAREVEKMGDTTVFKLQQPYGAIATTMGWAGAINYNQKFVIRNAFELLDTPGEFYFNRKTKELFYYSEGEDMNSAEVVAPLSDGLIQLKGTSNDSRIKNIRFEGITFSYDHWQLLDVEGSHGFAGIQSLGLAVKYVPGGNWHPTEYNSTNVPRGSIHIENAENIQIIRNRFEGISSAIAVNLVNDVKNCKVTGNYFNDLLGNAVNTGHPQHYKIGDGALFAKGVEGLCEFNKISNNYLRNVSLDFRQVEGITSFFVANTTIEHNDIAWTPYGAITCGWWWGNAGIPPSKVAGKNCIRYNKAGNTHQVLDDGGIIYLLGEQPGTRVEGNYLFNGPRCIYPDDGSAYLTITGNVIDNGRFKHWWVYFWNKRCHDNIVHENHVMTNLLVNNSESTLIGKTYNYFVERSFSGDALKIIKNAGIKKEYMDIIPESEPERIRIYPKSYELNHSIF